MKLTDLTPRPSKIYLSSTGKEYTLRPWTLKDQIWMGQEYGKQVNEIFNKDNVDIVAIARMAYRLMADKTDFKIRDIKEINEEGLEVKEQIGGYKLLITMVTDVKEQLNLLASVMECIGLSMPEVDELRNLASGDQKKTQ